MRRRADFCLCPPGDAGEPLCSSVPWFSHLYNGLKALSPCGVTPADRLTLGAGEGVGLSLGFGHEDHFQPVLGSPQERLRGPQAGLGAAWHKLPVPHTGLLLVTTPAATEIKQAAIIITKYYLIIPSQSSTDLFLRGVALPPTTQSVSAETMATARTVPLHIRMHSHCHPHQHQQPAFILQRQKKMFRFHPTACTASHGQTDCRCRVARARHGLLGCWSQCHGAACAGCCLPGPSF